MALEGLNLFLLGFLHLRLHVCVPDAEVEGTWRF